MCEKISVLPSYLILSVWEWNLCWTLFWRHCFSASSPCCWNPKPSWSIPCTLSLFSSLYIDGPVFLQYTFNLEIDVLGHFLKLPFDCLCVYPFWITVMFKSWTFLWSFNFSLYFLSCFFFFNFFYFLGRFQLLPFNECWGGNLFVCIFNFQSSFPCPVEIQLTYSVLYFKVYNIMTYVYIAWWWPQ